MSKIILIISFLILTFSSISVKAEKNYIFFDIELGVPLKNEDILTGEYDFFWEVFKPTKINKTFNKYLFLIYVFNKDYSNAHKLNISDRVKTRLNM